MSYEDMARSHVLALAREAFEVDEVVVDEDGDLPFPCGTAVVYLSVVCEGRLLRVWSRAVGGLRVTGAVLREVNEVNVGLCVARAYAVDRSVFVEGWLPVETLRAQDVAALCHEVGRTADRLGSLLAAVHGGQVARPEGRDSTCERGE